MTDEALTFQPLTRAEKAFTEAFVSLLKDIDFEKIHVSEILKRSGFSRGSFYSHFFDKYDFANKILQREMQIYVQHAIDYVIALEKGNDYSQLLSIITKFMEHIYENRDLYDAILDSRFPGITLDDYCNELKNMFTDRVSTTLYGLDKYCDQALFDYIEFYGGILHIKYWRLHNYSILPEDMAKKILSLIANKTYTFHALER